LSLSDWGVSVHEVKIIYIDSPGAKEYHYHNKKLIREQAADYELRMAADD
jgi:hypothetical protein